MIPERKPTLQCWAALAAIFLILDAGLIRLFGQGLGSDWATVWVPAKLSWTNPSKVYDFNLVTALQTPLFGHVDNRPHGYPPSVLLLVAPLGLLPFRLSLAIVSLGSALFLMLASRPLATDRKLLLIAPPVVLCMIAGQPSLLVAALAAAAISRLESREVMAGALLGLAVAVKPTMFLLAPLALLAGRHWRALIASGATAVAIVAASAMVFGVGQWLRWFQMLPQFQELVLNTPTLLSSTITPYTVAVRLGLDPRLAMGLGALVAIPLAAVTFARSRNAAVRLVVMLGGSLLMTPYAMNYDLALLAPAVLSLPLSSPRRLVLPTIWAASLCSGASLLGLAAVYSWAAFQVLRPSGSTSDDRLMEPGVHVRA